MKKLKILIFLLTLTSSFIIYSFKVQAESINYDISTAPIVISGDSDDDYIISGNTENNYITIEPGYNGTVTLQNINISIRGSNSPIAIQGKDNCPNSSPISNIDIVLEGDNYIEYKGNDGCAAIQVDQGTQINISAINPQDNSSGILTAKSSSVYAGAGIGALNHHHNTNEATSSNTILGECGTSATTAGGNIIISSGTITAKGGHSAGIGGGHETYYDGMIVIYGGKVTANSMRHAAGIGSGCPCHKGVVDCCTPTSSIIALPPAQLSAGGAGLTNNVVIPEYALSGANSIIYIGDPSKPEVTVRTEDNTPNADILVDLSENPTISSVLAMTVASDRLDVNKIKFGTTDKNGIYQFNGILQDTTSFFTNACSIKPKTLGRPYMSKDTILESGGTVILKLLETNVALFAETSSPLEENYTTEDALKNAYCYQLIYSDSIPTYNVSYDLARGKQSDFGELKFYYADRSTQIPTAPTTLTQGDTIFIVTPIKVGKTNGNYSDILRIKSAWKGSSTSYIKQVVKQAVCEAINVTLCPNESYFFNDQNLNISGTYYDTLQSSAGNDSLIILHLTILNSQTITDTLSLFDYELPYIYANTTIDENATSGDYTINTQSNQGCNITIQLHLDITPTFDIELDTNNLSTCPDSKRMNINYKIDYGEIDSFAIYFDNNALKKGFNNAEKQALTYPIQIELPDSVESDIYYANICFSNSTCTKEYSVRFNVDYSSNIIVNKWNGVLALLNSQYNGGYNFKEFQWYKDGEELSNETNSYIDTRDYLNTDTSANFAVKITRDDDVILFTCLYHYSSDISSSEIAIYPTIVNRNQSITVTSENKGQATIWSTLGGKKQTTELTNGTNKIPGLNEPGTYVLIVSDENNILKQQIIIII